MTRSFPGIPALEDIQAQVEDLRQLYASTRQDIADVHALIAPHLASLDAEPEQNPRP